jgi:hypothetical protein
VRSNLPSRCRALFVLLASLFVPTTVEVSGDVPRRAPLSGTAIGSPTRPSLEHTGAGLCETLLAPSGKSPNLA